MAANWSENNKGNKKTKFKPYNKKIKITYYNEITTQDNTKKIIDECNYEECPCNAEKAVQNQDKDYNQYSEDSHNLEKESVSDKSPGDTENEQFHNNGKNIKQEYTMEDTVNIIHENNNDEPAVNNDTDNLKKIAGDVNEPSVDAEASLEELQTSKDNPTFNFNQGKIIDYHNQYKKPDTNYNTIIKSGPIDYHDALEKLYKIYKNIKKEE